MSWSTVIGERYQRSFGARAAALVLGGATVAYDLSGIEPDVRVRLGVAALATLALLAVARGDLATVGIARPRPSVRWWLKATLITGTVFSVIVLGIAAVLRATGHTPPIPYIESAQEFLWRACVLAPLAEEPIYRIAVCAPLVILIGRWPTIFVSCILFALIHARYGGLAPDNALAGLLLGWAYLRSGSIVVPLVLHAIGNALVLGFWLYIAPYVL